MTRKKLFGKGHGVAFSEPQEKYLYELAAKREWDFSQAVRWCVSRAMNDVKVKA